VTIRVGLNSGDIVVRAIGNDLHMDYTVIGQTVHLASRMEQMAKPGSVLITANTLQLAEGYISIRSLGPAPVKGLADPLQILPYVSRHDEARLPHRHQNSRLEPSRRHEQIQEIGLHRLQRRPGSP
jgi:class 3 adenylate cyclase